MSAPAETGDPIVVVGGGAAGLELVTRLSRRRRPRREVVLVDRQLGHIWKPRLHEIATAMQSQADAESSFVGHASEHHYRYEPGVLSGIDPDRREIELEELVGPEGRQVLPSRRIRYGTLVLALGSEENDFGTPGAKAHCLFLNTAEQAGQIRAALLAGAFAAARGQQHRLSIAVIGGGATGVELAAEIKHAMDEFRQHEPGLDADRVRIVVVEASERLLNGNPQEMSDYAQDSLRRSGIEVVLGQQVTEVDGEGIVLHDGRRIVADLRIWTAGIRGPRVFEQMPALPRTRSGRVPVNALLQCQGLADIHALGDCAEWTDPATGRPAPYTAQVAAAQARYLAEAIEAREHERAVKPFRFENAGTIVSLGEGGAAGNLTTRFGQHSKDHAIQGLSARLVYTMLYRQHEFSILGWRGGIARMLVDWLGHAYQPALKLH